MIVDNIERYIDATAAAQRRVDLAAAAVDDQRRQWVWCAAVTAVSAVLLSLSFTVDVMGLALGIVACIGLLGACTFAIARWTSSDMSAPRVELTAAREQLRRITNGEGLS